MNPVVALGGQMVDAEALVLNRANGCSSADKPDQRLPALRQSHSLAVARAGGEPVSLGNAISGGHLEVYSPHMRVLPQWQGRRVGRLRMRRSRMLTAKGTAAPFYKRNWVSPAPAAPGRWGSTPVVTTNV